MGNKGLFELIFILVMLVLMLPATTHHSAIVTYSAQAQVNDLLLLTDQAIADALADSSYVGCNASESRVQNYVNNLQSDYQTNINSNCQVTISGTNFSSSTYSGIATATCSKVSGDTSTYITKRMAFNKTITTTSAGGFCRVQVVDNLSNPTITQVDYNLSFP